MPEERTVAAREISAQGNPRPGTPYLTMHERRVRMIRGLSWRLQREGTVERRTELELLEREVQRQRQVEDQRQAQRRRQEGQKVLKKLDKLWLESQEENKRTAEGEARRAQICGLIGELRLRR